MSTDITKKHHYVWRRYLRAWKVNPDDKDIWTGFLQTGEVKKVALMSVAQSSYFYKFEVLNDEEIAFLQMYMKKLSPNVKSVAEIILNGYIMFGQLKRQLSSAGIIDNPEIEHELKKIEAGTFETIQSQIEGLGDDLLNCKSIGELESLVQKDANEILFYLMVQYLRTKTMKDRLVNSLTERKMLQSVGHKCWPFFNFVSALQIVEIMAKRNDYRFALVNNKSTIPFITGDQPVFNALEDITDANGDVLGLELYYPMSPQTALKVAFDSGKKYEELDGDEEFVKIGNQLIKKQSQIHIFANSEDTLRMMLS